jgi:nucleotide-binding universal stress UspA family protein
LVGVARFIRLRGGGEVAEPAITVVDDWQQRGVGTALVEALSSRAREEGIRRFEAPVLADNVRAIRVLQGLGETTQQRNRHELILSIELPPSALPSRRWRPVLRQFALAAVVPGRSILGRVWTRRSGSPDDELANLFVVGADGSSSAADALAVVGELAAASGAAVHVIGAARFLSGDAGDLPATVDAAAASLRALGIDTTSEVRRGAPGLVLTDAAVEHNARLIVVGAGDRGKTARRLIGSVADYVAECSPCNVLIVRPRT